MIGVPPYLTADPAAIRLQPWHRVIDGASVPLPEILDGWDYATDLHLVRDVAVDLDRVRESTELPTDVPIGWVVTWRAAESKLTGATQVQPVASGSVSVTALIPGAELGARVHISTQLVLTEERTTSEPGTAIHAGSVLHDDTRPLTLLGDLAQFPIAVVDFAAARLDPDASIVVELDSDPGTPVLAGVQLLLNVRDQELVDAASSASSSDPLRLLLTSQIGEHVTRELISYATRHSDELLATPWEAGSIGAACLGLVDRIEHVDGLVALATMEQERPGLLQSVVAGEARRNGIGRQLP